MNNLVEFSPDAENQFVHQLKTTADWCCGSWWANYLTGGLNHQVIHHVYPHHPSYAYPELSKWLKEEMGDNYKVMGGSLFEVRFVNTLNPPSFPSVIANLDSIPSSYLLLPPRLCKATAYGCRRWGGAKVE